MQHESGEEYHDVAREFKALSHIIYRTDTLAPAWEAYVALVSLDRKYKNANSKSSIPRTALHKVARLLSKEQPRTRQIFTRLLSVLTTLKSIGGTIQTWEWNSLIDAGGKGWRKASIKDYRSSLGIFKDTLDISSQTSNKDAATHPNIVTFTILLSLSARTLLPSAIGHAESLLASSGLPLNNITRRALIPFYTKTNQLHILRDIALAAVSESLDIEFINACIWAYAYHGRLRTALMIYARLRRNVSAAEGGLSESSEEDEMDQVFDENSILSIPGFLEKATMPPDAVTYTSLIQALCYHGDLIAALTVFRDMITTVDPSTKQERAAALAQPLCFQPSMGVYRGIFLGFARHAGAPRGTRLRGDENIDQIPLPEFAARLAASQGLEDTPIPPPRTVEFDTPWSLDNLEKLFTRFLQMQWARSGVLDKSGEYPVQIPSDRVVYWIMTAFKKASHHDPLVVSSAWDRLHIRFKDTPLRKRMSHRLRKFEEDLEKQLRKLDHKKKRVNTFASKPVK